MRSGSRTLTPAIPGKRTNETPLTNIRTIIIKLILREKRLRRLANACAKLWNELTYERRQQYFNNKRRRPQRNRTKVLRKIQEDTRQRYSTDHHTEEQRSMARILRTTKTEERGQTTRAHTAHLTTRLLERQKNKQEKTNTNH